LGNVLSYILLTGTVGTGVTENWPFQKWSFWTKCLRKIGHRGLHWKIWCPQMCIANKN